MVIDTSEYRASIITGTEPVDSIFVNFELFIEMTSFLPSINELISLYIYKNMLILYYLDVLMFYLCYNNNNNNNKFYNMKL